MGHRASPGYPLAALVAIGHVPAAAMVMAMPPLRLEPLAQELLEVLGVHLEVDLRLLPGAVTELLLYGTMMAEGKLLGHATVFLLYKKKLVYLDNNLKTPLCDDPSLLPMTVGKFDWD